MRRINSWVALGMAAVFAACQGTTVPERREILGSWVSEGFAPATIRMTVAETAREIRGAGSWVTSTDAHAFAVTGAIAGDEVALLFESAGRTDVTFQGAFQDDDLIEGSLTGDGVRGAAVTFIREDLLPDD